MLPALPQIIDERFVDRHAIHVQNHMPRDLGLQMGLALQQPDRDKEKIEKPLPDQLKKRLEQQISPNQRTIQIDTDRDQ
ncbi:hypothetical protein SAE02_25390 [Skermanella aerolata]|uniref:Uncharacterized protein n=1 Tax=Skermanella aerolata TaxID=393310 RepID=A0A512DPJ0_9PROT|nr:hypothetical protein SAE02_25390 [Skermanella aerolata]